MTRLAKVANACRWINALSLMADKPRRPATKEDLEAKRTFVRAYFDDIAQKIVFLNELYMAGRRDEALLLVCVYLDGVSNWLRGLDGRTAQNFCEALVEFGGEPVFGLVLPERLEASLPWKSAPPEAVGARARLAAAPRHEALDRVELRAFLAGEPARALSWVDENLWRGTIASVVHERIRSPNIHSLGSPGGISFSSTTHRGQALPPIEFATLYRALNRLFDHARELSISSDTWFGVL